MLLVRKCSRCGEVRSLRDFFGNKPVTHSRVCEVCKRDEKAKARSERRNEKRRKKVVPAGVQFEREHPYFSKKLRQAGLTPLGYLVKVRNQEYKCAACGSLMDKFLYPHLDKRGKVRGLVCEKCAAVFGTGAAVLDLLKIVQYLSSSTSVNKEKS